MLLTKLLLTSVLLTKLLPTSVLLLISVLQLATKLGATDIVDVRNGDPVEQVRELTKGQVHHAIEAMSPQGWLGGLVSMLADLVIGIVVGALVLGLVKLFGMMRGTPKAA